MTVGMFPFLVVALTIFTVTVGYKKFWPIIKAFFALKWTLKAFPVIVVVALILTVTVF